MQKCKGHSCFIGVAAWVVALLMLPAQLSSQDKESLVRSNLLYKQGKELYAAGRYEDAIAVLKESANIQRLQQGGNTARMVGCMKAIGSCYAKMNEPESALAYFQRALSIKEKVDGKFNSGYALLLAEMGRCYSKQANYSSARKSYEQALTIYEKIEGKAGAYAKCLNHIGPCYRRMGDITKALECHREALAIFDRVKGKECEDYAFSLKNIGSCYYDLGDYAKALNYYQQVLPIREKLTGKDTPGYSLTLSDIGRCYRRMEDYPQALKCFRQALSIYGNTMGKESPAYANSLNNLGACYSDAQDFTEALAYYKQASSIREKVYGKNHPTYAMGLNYIGDCYRNMKNYAQAMVYYRQALAISEKVYGRNHPAYASGKLKIGQCYYSLGENSQAIECYKSYTSIISDIVTRTFSSSTESQRESFWGRFSNWFTNHLFEYASSLSSPEMTRTAYNGALLGKGLLLNAEMEMRKLILEGGDREALRVYNEILECRKELDKIVADPVGKSERIEALNSDIEARQQELMRRSKVFGDYTRNLALKWTDVQSALGKKDIAIEFETYTHKDTMFYIALTLRPDYSAPHLVPLFNSKELDDIKPKDFGRKPFSDRIYQSSRMTDLVWGRLADELDGVGRVFFSPAGDLHNIGIEYLQDKTGQHLVSERRSYYRLTSTRELAKSHPYHKMAEATVYGGILYDDIPSRDDLQAIRGGTRFGYLEGSAEEAKVVSSMLTSMQVKNDLLEGKNGTEESFKALSGAKKNLLHISTHGFYWSEKEAAHQGKSFILDDDGDGLKEDRALTRSGLLFAGAQKALDGRIRPDDKEDGILTAKDISRMDLRGTDLVVLSACQTGLGDVTGEGVFGLQRGFKKAGVQSIVMSLWEVDDIATKIIMTRFYENLARRQSIYDAFLEAQNYLRKYDAGTYNVPEYYAAFVLLDAVKEMGNIEKL